MDMVRYERLWGDGKSKLQNLQSLHNIVYGQGAVWMWAIMMIIILGVQFVYDIIFVIYHRLWGRFCPWQLLWTMDFLSKSK